jgi:hypothetical protein
LIGVVAVGLGGEDRAEQQARTPELDRIVQPALQLPQPVPDGLFLRQLRFLAPVKPSGYTCHQIA